MEENKIEVVSEMVEQPKEIKNEVIKKEKLAEEMGLVLPKSMGDVVLNSVMSSCANETLKLPKNYNVGNALKGAVLTLQQTMDKNGQPLMAVCTKDSIAQSLLEMVLQGLDVSSKQAYFIVRGSKLTLMRSYFGAVKVLKRLPNIKDVYATVVYEGDDFEIDNEQGRTIIKTHNTSFANMDNEIIGAYATVEKNDGQKIITVMTKKEINKAWSKTSSSGGTQKEYPQEMAKRTVINRACKMYINTECEDDVLARAYNNTLENEFETETKQNMIIKETKSYDI